MNAEPHHSNSSEDMGALIPNPTNHFVDLLLAVPERLQVAEQALPVELRDAGEGFLHRRLVGVQQCFAIDRHFLLIT